MGIPGNDIADEEAKAALEDDFLVTEKPTKRSDKLDQNRKQEKQDGKIAKMM
jgi:hypothetical protein